MSALEQISQYQKLWTVILPHVATPPPEDVARWLDFPTNTIEQAIVRTAKRFAREKITPSFDSIQAYRYTSSVARSIRDLEKSNLSVAISSTTSSKESKAA
jgi:hypothetical protein